MNWLIWSVPGITTRVAPAGFGVALFFLISGFVIPFSFRRQSRLGFLAGRALRLWPTYAAGLAVAVVALFVGAWALGEPFPYRWRHLLVNFALGTRDLTGVTSIDGIVWTLEIELKFYLLCALLAPWLAAGRARALYVAAPVLLAVVFGAGAVRENLAAAGPRVHQLGWVAAVDAQFMLLMFVGTAFHFLYRGFVGRWHGVALIAGLFAVACVAGYGGFLRAEQYLQVGNQTAALAAFALCYVARGRIRGGGLLGWLADVSYPLYVSHAVVGYVLMNLLLRRGVSADLTLAAGVGLAMLLAWALHVAVERPTHEWARRAARRLSPSPTTDIQTIPAARAA
jgi:peptidoglycan/LPS O-acetylase OafA/YrhL